MVQPPDFNDNHNTDEMKGSNTTAKKLVTEQRGYLVVLDAALDAGAADEVFLQAVADLGFGKDRG